MWGLKNMIIRNWKYILVNGKFKKNFFFDELNYYIWFGNILVLIVLKIKCKWVFGEIKILLIDLCWILICGIYDLVLFLII